MFCQGAIDGCPSLAGIDEVISAGGRKGFPAARAVWLAERLKAVKLLCRTIKLIVLHVAKHLHYSRCRRFRIACHVQDRRRGYAKKINKLCIRKIRVRAATKITANG